MESIQFGLANNYDSGRYNSIATNERISIEVHNSESSGKMWYHIGLINKATIEWGESTPYSDGFSPSVAINNKNIVVEVHETSNILTHSMYAKVGLVNGSTIEWWGKDEKYDTGVQPCIAINDYGVLVEVHKSQSHDVLYYRVGKLNGKTISWGKSHDYEKGSKPSVAITNSGWVVEVHQSESPAKLHYRVGHINGDSINWSNSIPYQDGINPSIAITDDGRIIEVHESQGITGLWQMSGVINGTSILWSKATNFDSGSTPKAAISSSGQVAVQVHASEGLSFGLWYSLSRLMNTADFMRDLLPLTQDLPLKKMVFPASHDAGMYTHGLETLGKTQDLNLYQQLEAGVRYFDLRPDKNLNIYHGFTGPSVQEVLDDVKLFYKEGHRELAILKFSHFDGFTSAIYETLKTMINDTIGPWLFRSIPDGYQRLADIPMGTYLKDSGQILVVIDDNWAVTDEPKEGFWVYRDWQDNTANLGDLTVFDIYSNSMFYSTMETDQLQKFNAFNGQCCSKQKNDSWECQEFSQTPCDLFLLSWTLTPPTAVWLFAKEPDSNLGRIMSYLQPNTNGYFPNILYLDYTEYARPTFIAELFTKIYNNITHRSALPKEVNEMAG
ncbi:hypothetical protein E6C50_15820 [Flavobacterium supellecticarium]|uniref:1-phosphatidylinositol phosphodiesterase n=1 Tax=Flavobacterium supellecticarium TaxID=2565924 RepID=A0A4S3ZQN9_9FLAO|nr:hypothetical protein [Flavobacterium supellecticarium]THF47899.1 hypothetical protein E6C50_15820 [Flavobacterium supellecticarium]